ncbi:MAG: HPr family phosphocarrier protein [Thermaerobacter sp.]|nr:HPr family phosphocarrier protein [Thermaerobacter sp.]
MPECLVTIRNPTGLHARPASTLVQLAKSFQSEITLSHGDKAANAKSILAVLSLGATQGTCIRIATQGPDAEPALRAVESAINEGLGEGPKGE